MSAHDLELRAVPGARNASARADMGLPSTQQLLTEGGDARIVLDAGGVNKYGCAPLPDPELVALGSSTASIISTGAFAAADLRRNKVAQAIAVESEVSVYTSEMHRIRRELLLLCGMPDGAGVDVVFAASGTDIHLIAAQAFCSGETQPPLVIMVDPNETGSGVAAALTGRHFSSHSALGDAVVSGASIAHAAPIEVVQVALRDVHGNARDAQAVDADFEMLAGQAANAGRRVLLILIDGSKTGTIAPTTACALKIQQQFAGRIDVMVDACQFRIAPSTLRAYLQRDFMVALTGSKFLTGPTFAGALLIPPLCARRLRRHPIPLALRGYSARADWPQDWSAASALNQVANFGMLLRWEAALHELRAFRAVPEDKITDFLAAFGHAVQQKLADSPLLEAVPLPVLDRQPLVGSGNWDHIPTIHPFLLYKTDGVALNRDQTVQVYRLLQTDLSGREEFSFDDGIDHDRAGLAAMRCQLGQPVAFGQRGGIPVSALRVCASVRMVVQATAGDGSGAKVVIANTLAALDKAIVLAKSLATG